MQELYIEGGRRLEGELIIDGAKNSVLPLLAATVLVPEPVTLVRCPPLSDVDAALDILQMLGCHTQQNGERITVDARALSHACVEDRLMRRMRSSIMFLGPLLAMRGEAQMSLPGGCELGPRPINWHIDALVGLGAVVREGGGSVYLTAPHGLHGAELSLMYPSVGVTENVTMAAVTARGVTVLHGVAREPEVADVCRFLNACGARIDGIGGDTLTITGVDALHGCTYDVMPDRIETITYALAAAMTGGDVCLHGVDAESIQPTLSPLAEMGCTVRCAQGDLYVQAPTRLSAPHYLRSMPYPAFPTDALAPFMAAACVAQGTTLMVETVFENRYRHVDELRRMGADIRVDGRVALIEGTRLYGTSVRCTDLRGGAALVLAALAAEGCSSVGDIHHLKRGYPKLVEKLTALGACVQMQCAESI